MDNVTELDKARQAVGLEPLNQKFDWTYNDVDQRKIEQCFEYLLAVVENRHKIARRGIVADIKAYADELVDAEDFGVLSLRAEPRLKSGVEWLEAFSRRQATLAYKLRTLMLELGTAFVITPGLAMEFTKNSAKYPYEAVPTELDTEGEDEGGEGSD